MHGKNYQDKTLEDAKSESSSSVSFELVLALGTPSVCLVFLDD